MKKDKVWFGSKIAPGLDSAKWRLDCDGKLICYDEYGKYNQYGWQIDHDVPKALGGGDEPSNLNAMRSVDNDRKGARTLEQFQMDEFIQNLREIMAQY